MQESAGYVVDAAIGLRHSAFDADGAFHTDDDERLIIVNALNAGVAYKDDVGHGAAIAKAHALHAVGLVIMSIEAVDFEAGASARISSGQRL